MSPEQFEQRLRRYGETLEHSLKSAPLSAPSDRPNMPEGRRWWLRQRSLVAVAAVGAVLLSVAGWAALRDDSSPTELVITSPVDPSADEDSVAVQQCREGYKLVIGPGGNDEQMGPGIELDPTVLDAAGVVLVSATEPETATVILVGNTLVVRCLILEVGAAGSLPDIAVERLGNKPSATGIEVPNPQGIGATNGPVTVRFYGRAGAEVQEVSLIAGDGRSAGVLQQGWFVVEMVLEGQLKDLNEIVLEWVTTSGLVDSQVILAYDETLGGFIPVLSDP